MDEWVCPLISSFTGKAEKMFKADSSSNRHLSMF